MKFMVFIEADFNGDDYEGIRFTDPVTGQVLSDGAQRTVSTDDEFHAVDDYLQTLVDTVAMAHVSGSIATAIQSLTGEYSAEHCGALSDEDLDRTVRALLLEETRRARKAGA